jgi:Uma2 family endonuclease
MSSEIARRPFTVTEFERMAEVGILTEDDRVELLDGDIVTMSPIGRHHAACVKRLNAALSRLFRRRAIVSVQDPVRLSDFSVPQPDIALLEPREDFYASAHPAPQDILLIIEVADSTLALDLGTKLPLYARAGIAEAWLIDLGSGVVSIFTEPKRGRYSVRVDFRGDARIESATLGRHRLLVSDILP